ncbi:MAG: 16S rRNA (cytosine(1402)-N(4))-methyltransferase RsmH [Bacteroidales bacterium]|nr:16S rRNA (cytosine(1402)-N(4))-methyltransferase RsmH [Bacteroidales bacterium]
MYHNPVMLHECMEGLSIKPAGVYVDVTYGSGGHSRRILQHLNENGKLIAFDQDEDALKNQTDDPRLTLVHQNFSFITNFCRFYGHTRVDGILADLGVSSHQLDIPEKGFSTRFNGTLDMRMSQKNERTAADIVNGFEKNDLVRLFRQYGEIENAPKVADAIIKRRSEKPIETTMELMNTILPYSPRMRENKFTAQVFQALRIEVNQELEVLKELLSQSAELLNTGGRLVVLSYHSLEDRLVKNFMRAGNFEGVVEKDFYGNPQTPFRLVARKPITASEAEVATNSRARSAKLRIAEKIEIK